MPLHFCVSPMINEDDVYFRSMKIMTAPISESIDISITHDKRLKLSIINPKVVPAKDDPI